MGSKSYKVKVRVCILITSQLFMQSHLFKFCSLYFPILRLSPSNSDLLHKEDEIPTRVITRTQEFINTNFFQWLANQTFIIHLLSTQIHFHNNQSHQGSLTNLCSDFKKKRRISQHSIPKHWARLHRKA